VRFFDRWKKTVTLPEGHQLTNWRANPTPYVRCSPGGVLVANLGSSSDDSIGEALGVFSEIEAALLEGPRVVLLNHGPVRISDLFAPSTPRVRKTSNLIIWLILDDSLTGWREESKRLQQLLRRWYQLGARKDLMIGQIAFVPGDGGSETSFVVSLLEGLGIAVRTFDSDEVLLTDVQRPEGVTICALGGEQHSSFRTQVDAYLLTVNQEKDSANEDGDEERLIEIMEQERNWLAAKIAQADAAGKPEPRWVMRAVRLRALLLAADSEAGWRALCEELLAREVPVIMMADRAGEISQMSWPEGGVAIPVFPDEISFRLAAADLNFSLESTGIVAMKPRELFVWASEVGTPVALNVYRDRESPIYYPLSAEDVRFLTEGKIPNRST